MMITVIDSGKQIYIYFNAQISADWSIKTWVFAYIENINEM